LHTLSALSTTARDENIVATIKTAIENHSRVLVVYGASHLGFEWEELVRFMGMPKKTKPF
jgi:phosphoheptose isomerase